MPIDSISLRQPDGLLEDGHAEDVEALQRPAKRDASTDARLASLACRADVAGKPPRSKPTVFRKITLAPALGTPQGSMLSHGAHANPPYRPLPLAVGPADGSFLAPRVEHYVPEPQFVQRMAAAEEDLIGRLRSSIEQHTVSPMLVHSALQHIAAVRRQIAHDLGQEGANYYGLPLHPGDMAVDCVSADPSNRHSAYYARAARWADASPFQIGQDGEFVREHVSLSIRGQCERVPLCFPVRQANGDVHILHPTGSDLQALSSAAYERLAHVLASPQQNEEAVLRMLGEAHYLAMHGTPFQRGTPSIVETFIDATLRVRYGRRLTRKIEGVEPFWEAIFTSGALLEDYSKRFRDFFE